MALAFAHGAVQWLSAHAAATEYAVTGLGFAPKALRFYWFGIQSAVDSSSKLGSPQPEPSERRGVGFAAGDVGSPTDITRRAVSSFSQNRATTSNCDTSASDDAVAVTTDGAGARDGLLDIIDINADGFTLRVDDAAPADITVFWEAWGGSDIEAVTVGDIAAPGSATTQDVAASGFELDASDQAVMFAGVQSTAALNSGLASDSGLSIGFATCRGGSPSEFDQVVVCGNADDSSGTMDTDGYCQTGDSIAMVVVAGGTTLNSRAQVIGFYEGGFRLNWTTSSVANQRHVFMAVKGGGWRAGAYTINGSSASATATVSGIAFAPVGLSLIGRMSAQQSAGATATNDRIGMGSGISTASRRAMSAWDETATASSAANIHQSIEYDSVLTFAANTGLTAATYDIDAMNSDGFRIIVDTAGGVSSEWQGYLAFGDAPLVGITGDLAQTLGTATTTSEADLALAAAATQTLAEATTTTDVDISIAASIAQTLGMLDLDATLGNFEVLADFVQTLGAATLAANDTDLSISATLQ